MDPTCPEQARDSVFHGEDCGVLYGQLVIESADWELSEGDGW